jgi:hypothetical protein
MGRILVVEDNSALAEGLAYNLRHRVTTSASPRTASAGSPTRGSGRPIS